MLAVICHNSLALLSSDVHCGLTVFFFFYFKSNWHGNEQYVVFERCVMLVRRLSLTSTGSVANVALVYALIATG